MTVRAPRWPRGLVALATVLGLILLCGSPAQAADPPADPASGIALDAVPALARASLPLIMDLTTRTCPELPPVWVVAQVEAESGWDPTLHADQPGGAAGLYQFGQQNWLAAGGAPWAADPPPGGSAVLTADTHLRIAVPWVCATLRAVTAHLRSTGKPAAPLDAMLVCHIAGCARVTGSRTGIPQAGEADCDARCAAIIRRYVDAVHDDVTRFSAALPASATPAGPAAIPTAAVPDRSTPAIPAPSAPAPAAPDVGPARGVEPGAPAAWTGGATACLPPDPTSRGCLTGATRHGLDAVGAAFDGWRDGPVVRSTGCWDRHAWNPRSDHPRGRACDFMVTTPGTFAAGSELDAGWRLANWLRAHAGALHVSYLIWQGRYWDPTVRDDPGSWGVRYTGAGVYDVRTATGGHFDHIHTSFEE